MESVAYRLDSHVHISRGGYPQPCRAPELGVTLRAPFSAPHADGARTKNSRPGISPGRLGSLRDGWLGGDDQQKPTVWVCFVLSCFREAWPRLTLTNTQTIHSVSHCSSKSIQRCLRRLRALLTPLFRPAEAGLLRIATSDCGIASVERFLL